MVDVGKILVQINLYNAQHPRKMRNTSLMSFPSVLYMKRIYVLSNKTILLKGRDALKLLVTAAKHLIYLSLGLAQLDSIEWTHYW